MNPLVERIAAQAKQAHDAKYIVRVKREDGTTYAQAFPTLEAAGQFIERVPATQQVIAAEKAGDEDPDRWDGALA